MCFNYIFVRNISHFYIEFKFCESLLVSHLFVLIRNVMSVVITEIYGNKEKIAEHSKNGSLVV